jgi:choline-sulfatase
VTELAGAPAPEDWDGDSMVGWLDDADAPWKDLAVSEYYAHNIASGFAMLRHGPYKYVYHARMDDQHGPERELYNLDDDPGEFDNLAEHPEHRERVTELHRMLVAELGREPDETEQICRADLAKGYDR